MNSNSLASAKTMNAKNIAIAAGAAIIVLGIVGWTAGWFGGEKPTPPAAPAATTEQPAAPGTTTAPATSGQQQGTTTTP